MASNHSIIAGPSKWNLSLALFDRNPGNPRLIDFEINRPSKFNVGVRVTSIQAKDDSGNHWNIEGLMGTMTYTGDRPVPEGNLRVFIEYRTDQRVGTIRFFEPKTSISITELDEIVRRGNERQFGDGRPVRR